MSTKPAPGFVPAGFGFKRPAQSDAEKTPANVNPSLGVVGTASGAKPPEISAVPPGVKALARDGEAPDGDNSEDRQPQKKKALVAS